MITRKPLALTSIIIALLLGTTGCTLIGNSPENENTPTATAPAPAPVETTPPAEPTETPTPEADAEAIKEGIYLDEWAKSINVYFQRAANIFLHENEGSGTLSPGDLQTFLDERIVTDTPNLFEVEATTTASNNFTIKVWHPDGYTHQDANTAYIGSSDPEVTSTPTPTPTPSDPARQLDARAPEILYNAAVWAGNFMRSSNGEIPTDVMLRMTDSIPDGWEWQISKNEFHPEYFLFKVWHSEAFLYNSPENAATYNNHPQPEMRPSYNVDVKPYVPIMGFTDPHELATPAPAPSEPPTPTSSPTTDGATA